MKTLGKSIFKGTTALLLLFLISVTSLTASQVEKTFSWKYPVNRETNLVFNNYNCDLIVHGWEKSETEYHLKIEATGKTEDDEKRLLKFLENYSFAHSGNEVKFGNAFWKNRRSVNGKTTLEIEGEKNIELTDFSMKGELWIPAGSSFELDSKYSRIDMEDLNGKLSLTLYNDNLFGSNLTKAPEIDAKYTTIEFKDMNGVNAELYNCNFTAAAVGAVNVDSKYSRFNAKNAGDVTISSYNDKFSFSSTGNLHFESKYSDLKSDLSGTVILDCYNGTIEITASKNVLLSSKYAEFRLGTTGEIAVGDTYNDKFIVGKANSFNIDVTKYSNYRIDELLSEISVADGYNDNITVTKTGEALKGIKVTGKYEDISLGISSSASFRLQTEIKYPTLLINESAFKTKVRIEDNTGLKFEGVKGTEKDGMPVIEVKGYEIKLKITDIK
jgi:hypothetical protein